MTRENLSKIFKMAWQFVKRNGMTISDALKVAWRNYTLKVKMAKGIVKFYFQKIDGSIREAYGTLSTRLTPATLGCTRRVNDTVQAYYDTEKGDWRCYKIANLIKIG